MKLYDISKEIFSAAVFPGDPAPAFQPAQRLAEGGHCNLTQVTLGTHSATHMDAPWHFVPGGKTIDQVELSRCVGPCQVVEAQGLLEKTWAAAVLQQGVKRLLLKGQAQLSVEAAQELAQGGLLLLGVEAMSVAPDDDPAPVHRALLEREVASGADGVLLIPADREVLSEAVETGDYILLAQPLKYGGLDGAQVRALLVEGSLEEA